MASGKVLLHDQVPKTPLRVVLINLEDSRETMDKRIAAVMREHGLTKRISGTGSSWSPAVRSRSRSRPRCGEAISSVMRMISGA